MRSSRSSDASDLRRWGAKGPASLLVLGIVVLMGLLRPYLTDPSGTDARSAKPSPAESAPAESAPAESAPAVVATAPPPQAATPSRSTTPSAAQANRNAERDDDANDLLFGILREIEHDRFLSPQGLLYTPGSAEGHRLEHLRRHTKDMPDRNGKHGVFDGGMEGALQTIDNAYERAKNKVRTTKQTDRDRTIYTVDMGKRVGYVGGREGNRRRKPMARRVRLVLEDKRVITAFPL